MKIVDLETLKRMPNGTVFCRVGKSDNIDWELTILTGRYKDRNGFNQTMSVLPESPDEKMFYLKDKKGNYRTDENLKTKWGVFNVDSDKYSKEMHFLVFSKAEVTKVIRALQWALSDLEDDFDMEEVLQ